MLAGYLSKERMDSRETINDKMKKDMRTTKIITLCAMLWGCGASLLMAETQTDSLATYIAAAIRNNPAVIGQYHAYRAQVMAACGEGQLNDPEITVNAF